MNLPNFLSVLRIVLMPLIIILLCYNNYLAAFAVFAVAAITDALDGLFARLFNQKTTLGSYLDPIADKLLLVSSFVTLALLKLIPPWLAILVVSRDIIISIGILVLRLNLFHVEILPSMISKCTTFFQILTIGLSLLFFLFEKTFFILDVVFWITAALTVVTGMHYIIRGLKVVNGSVLTGDK